MKVFNVCCYNQPLKYAKFPIHSQFIKDTLEFADSVLGESVLHVRGGPSKAKLESQKVNVLVCWRILKCRPLECVWSVLVGN